MVCFNQEEIVAGLMSEVCPFLKEMKMRDRLRPSQVFGSIQIVPQGRHQTQGPIFFKLSIYNGSQSRNSHRRHTLLGCNFLSWKKYRRKSAMDFTGGALKSTWLLWHHCKNGPLCLIDWSNWSSLRSLNLCCHHLREALVLDICGSRSQAWRFRFDRFLWRIWLNGWVNRLGRLGRHNGIWLDMATRSHNKACWASLEQSGWFCCMGSPATSPPLCKRWLPVGRHMGPDPPRTGWVHPMPKQGDLGPVKQNLAVSCTTWWQTDTLDAGATWSILLWKPRDGGTILSGWFDLAWIAGLPSHSVGLECVGLWELLVS